MTRVDILDAAAKIVTQDRYEQYGSPEDNFGLIAKLWEAYIAARCVSDNSDVCLEGEDVAMMMCLLKIARSATATESKSDTYIDIAGYAACGGELATKEV